MQIKKFKKMKNTDKKVRRHGDLDFLPSTISLKGLKKLGENSFVLAEGEKTGHHHTITKEKNSTVDVYEGQNGEMIISVNGKAILTHPEHKTLTFPTGIWEVRREQEYDWFSLEKRQVLD